MPYSLFSFIFLFAWTGAMAQNTVKWKNGPELPASAPGVGGAFTGISNEGLILAGGSFFPKDPPWKGGVKTYTDAIHVLVKDKEGKWNWKMSVGKLPRARAYGASVTIPEGVLCIGGSDSSQVFPDVCLLTWDPELGKVKVAKWPALDTPLMMCAGAFLGGKVYVFGGQDTLNGDPTSRAKSLDTTLDHGASEFEWQPAPSWDGPARILPVVVTQNDAEGPAIWLFSGRGRADGNEFKTLTDAWKFKPGTGVWKKLPDITVTGQGVRGVIGGSAQVYGGHILIFGGDDGLLTSVSGLMSSRILYTETEQAAWKKLTEALLDNHPGYTSEVLAFDVKGEKWGVATTSPQPLPVTNLVVRSGSDYFLLSGESKPGCRSQGVIISEWPAIPEAEAPVPKAVPVLDETESETSPDSPTPPDSVPANP